MILLIMILQFLLLQNYFNRRLDKQTEKVELLLKNVTTMQGNINEVKHEIKGLKK